LVLLLTALTSLTALAENPTIPLDATTARDLELFGEGVVGKAVPAPPLDEISEYFAFGPGGWHYEVVHGRKKAAKKIRVEHYAPVNDSGKPQEWKRTIGDEYVEYFRPHPDGGMEKYAEDDLEVGYGARMVPAITAPAGMKPGETRVIKSELRAYKSSNPDDIKYTGKVETQLTYIGAYEVTTPAGTWPAILVRNAFNVDIGPAKVTDTMYSFYAHGVGKIAEIETQNISALLVYHSKSKIAKVLSAAPEK